MSDLIAVIIPTRGIVFTQVMQGVFDNIGTRPARLMTTVDEGLPECMNTLVRRAVDAGAAWVWVVEEDTVPPSGVLDALLAMDVDYVACDYPVGHSHTCFGFDGDGLLWTGFGCTLIRASVFERIAEPWFECNRNMVVVKRRGLDYFTADGRTVNQRGGHDLSFAEKLKTAGIDRHGLDGWEAQHLKLSNWNTDSTNKACHDITPIPPIIDKWPAYIDDSPVAAIVIPCFNHGEYLAEAIESALAQTVRVEVVVVDDGSTDDSSAIALRYPVTLIRQSNKGLPAARNAGIRMTSAPHVLPLDADDVLDPDCVERLLAASTTGIVRSAAMLFGDVATRQWLPGGDLTLAGLMSANAAASCCLFPRSAWEKVGGYDESMRDGYEDWDMWVRMMAAGVLLVTAEGVCWHYRKHGESMVNGALAKSETIRSYMSEKWARLGITAEGQDAGAIRIGGRILGR